jgi:hypothetical protein
MQWLIKAVRSPAHNIRARKIFYYVVLLSDCLILVVCVCVAMLQSLVCGAACFSEEGVPGRPRVSCHKLWSLSLRTYSTNVTNASLVICVIVRGERAFPSAATAVRRAYTTHPPYHHPHTMSRSYLECQRGHSVFFDFAKWFYLVIGCSRCCLRSPRQVPPHAPPCFTSAVIAMSRCRHGLLRCSDPRVPSPPVARERAC